MYTSHILCQCETINIVHVWTKSISFIIFLQDSIEYTPSKIHDFHCQYTKTLNSIIYSNDHWMWCKFFSEFKAWIKFNFIHLDTKLDNSFSWATAQREKSGEIWKSWLGSKGLKQGLTPHYWHHSLLNLPLDTDTCKQSWWVEGLPLYCSKSSHPS